MAGAPPRARVESGLRVSLYVVQTAPYASLDIRDLTHPYWTISHVLRGRVGTSTGPYRSVVGEGEVMVHPPGVPFSEAADGPGVHQWFTAHIAAGDPGVPLPAADPLEENPLPLVLTLGRHRDRYAAAFDELEAAWNRPADAPGRGLHCAGGVARLVALLLDAWEDAGRPARPAALRASERQARFAPLLAFMAAHLHERLTRDDLAARACLHPGSFDRAFRQAHGTAPMRLLTEMRLSRARLLLETTDDTLDAVARACGLGEGPRLSRLFRARFGVTPGTHRLRARSTTDGYIPPLPPGGADA